MSMLINGKQVEFTPGETVLSVAKRSGIKIPHLCSLECVPNPAASCRMCMVEVQGMPRLQTSCTLQAKEGMAVQTHTQKIQSLRKNIVELLLASHPDDCLVCPRNGSCELSQLASELGIMQRRYSGVKREYPIDLSSPSIVRDANKCVLCGRCVTVCHAQQGVGAIDFAGRGFKTRVSPAYHEGLNVSGCVFCGQCVRVCPTGALVEKNHVARVVEALADPDCFVVAQVAPAVPATLMDKTEIASVRAMLERLASALKRIGFGAVFDTAFAADLTIMEEVSELISRVQNGGILPLITSCSPGWVQYVEMHRPDLIPHLSTCKSPQQMVGALIKEYYPRYASLGTKRLVSVSIMPCTAKKFEAQDLGDVDYVLTTRELGALLDRFGIDLNHVDERTVLDSPFGEATGAGRIFAATGGVMEAAIRTAHKMLTGKELKSGLKVAEARGLDGIKSFSVDAAGMTLNFAVVNGLGRMRSIMDPIRDGQSNLHFIEVMACPGGCVGGGGQPYNTDANVIRARMERLYDVDRRAKKRVSHDNDDVRSLYDNFLGKPLGETAHRLLHRHYVNRKCANS